MLFRSAVLVNDTGVDRHYGCTRVMRTVRVLTAARGLDLICTAPAHCDWRRDSEFLRAFDRAGMVIVNGEGTIHHDRAASRILLEVGGAARARGIPAVLINATWQANDPELVKMLKDFAIVSVRESASQRELAAAGISVRRVPDLSLYFPHRNPFKRTDIGFTDSVVWEVATRLAMLRREHGGIGVSMLNLVHGPADRLRLLRHVRTIVSNLATSVQARAIVQAWQEASFMARTEQELLDRIARLSLLVTGRFHALCFALLTRTPFVAVETNTHKIAGLIADSGTASWRAASVWTVDCAFFNRAEAWERGEIEALDDFLADTRRRIESLFDDISTLVR